MKISQIELFRADLPYSGGVYLLSGGRTYSSFDELAEQDSDIAFAVAHGVVDGIGLKISKAGGLTRGRRRRDMARAAGLTVSVQDTVGSAIAFAAIVQLGATVPLRMLRCVLNSEDMVTLRTARFDVLTDDGRILPPDAPGLGIEVDESVLGKPVAVWPDFRR